MSKSKIEIIYLSESGTPISFEIDSEAAENYGMTEILNLLKTGTGHFNKCLVYMYKAKKAKTLKDPKSKYYKLLFKENKKGLKEIRKIKKLLNKIRSLSKEDIEDVHKSRAMFEEKLKKLNLTEEERDAMLEEIATCSEILDTKGRKGLNTYIMGKIEKLEDVLSDPIEGWKTSSISVGALLVCILIVILVFGPLLAAIFLPQKKYLADVDERVIHLALGFTDECQRWEIENEMYFTDVQFYNAITSWGYEACTYCLSDD